MCYIKFYYISSAGTSGSGKSTVLKQMRIQYQGKFSDEDLVFYRSVIYHNLVEILKSLLKEADVNNIKLSDNNAYY